MSAIHDQACGAARALAGLGLEFTRISLGSSMQHDVLEQLSAESGASIVSTVHQSHLGVRTVFERVEWTVCGVTITASGVRPAQAGDESLPTYLFGADPLPVAISGVASGGAPAAVEASHA